MFIEDLHSDTYFAHGPNVRAVGWLEGDHPFARGEVPAGFLTALKAHVEAAHQVVLFRGFHECSLCPSREELTGFRNLLVPTRDLLYVAPELVVHYVEDHGYKPPDEFVAAVLACPPQGSAKYLARLRRFEPCWTRET